MTTAMKSIQQDSRHAAVIARPLARAPSALAACLLLIASVLCVVWMVAGWPGMPLEPDTMTPDERAGYCESMAYVLVLDTECLIRGSRKTALYGWLISLNVATR
jgi:hypothetical protein